MLSKTTDTSRSSDFLQVPNLPDVSLSPGSLGTPQRLKRSRSESGELASGPESAYADSPSTKRTKKGGNPSRFAISTSDGLEGVGRTSNPVLSMVAYDTVDGTPSRARTVSASLAHAFAELPRQVVSRNTTGAPHMVRNGTQRIHHGLWRFEWDVYMTSSSVRSTFSRYAIPFSASDIPLVWQLKEGGICLAPPF